MTVLSRRHLMLTAAGAATIGLLASAAVPASADPGPFALAGSFSATSNTADPSAESVAATGLADVAKNRTLAVPGVFYKGMVGATSITPRFITRRFSGMVGRT